MDYNYCQNCGRFSMDEGRYCTFCGKEFCEKMLVPCTSCGKNIAVESVFCTWCGEKCTPAQKEYFTFYEPEAEELSKISKNKIIYNKSSGVIRDVDFSKSDKTNEFEKNMNDICNAEESIVNKASGILQQEVITVSDDDFIIKKAEEGYVLEKYTGKGGDVVVPKGVTAIGANAFYSCISLKSIVIPDGVNKISKSAFMACYSLENIIIPDSVTIIENRAFWLCKSLTSIVIPDNVTRIEESTFSSCESLKSIVIPDGVKRIGEFAFKDCFSLTNINIPVEVRSIRDYSFMNCKSLTSIIIPDGVTSIKRLAFYGCSSLKNITIPSSVNKIGDVSLGFEDNGGKRAQRIKDFKIKCYKGTIGEKYSIKNGFNYELIG